MEKLFPLKLIWGNVYGYFIINLEIWAYNYGPHLHEIVAILNFGWNGSLWQTLRANQEINEKFFCRSLQQNTRLKLRHTPGHISFITSEQTLRPCPPINSTTELITKSTASVITPVIAYLVTRNRFYDGGPHNEFDEAKIQWMTQKLRLD